MEKGCTWEPREESIVEHMQAVVTNIFQRHWEWQEDSRTDLQPGLFRYNTAIMASLDVKTAFDVARSTVVSKILTLIGVHGHLTAAPLAEMRDVRESASFENSETEVRYSRCIRQGGVEAPVLWGRVAKDVLWKAEKKWKIKGWELPFGGQHDNDFVLRGMMWADNYWLLCDNREIDMHGERHQSRNYWTWTWNPSRNRFEEKDTIQAGSRARTWKLPFREVFDVLGLAITGTGRDTMRKGLRSWWRDKNIYRSKTVPMMTKCKRVHSRVYSTVLNGSINWPWSGGMINKIRA